MWPRRVLRFFQEQARHHALSPDHPPDYPVVRTGRILALVLCGRNLRDLDPPLATEGYRGHVLCAKELIYAARCVEPSAALGLACRLRTDLPSVFRKSEAASRLRPWSRPTARSSRSRSKAATLYWRSLPRTP